MLRNPLEHPVIWPLATVLGALFGITLALILIAARGNLAVAVKGSLFRRWRTWALIGPTFALLGLSGGLPLLALSLTLAIQGAREYAHLVGLPPLYRRVLLLMTIIILPTTLVSSTVYFGLPPLLMILATLQPLLSQDVVNGARHLAFAALGFAYLPWMLGYIVLLSQTVSGGDTLLIVIALSVALSDVGAFTVGSLIGRHKLAPNLSPGKTREGVLGNLIGAALGVGILWFALPEWLPLMARLALPVVLAFAAVWGDLVESLIKREFGVKDAGSWLPGFGGLLDRIDSLILAVPLSYYYVLAVRWVTSGSAP